VAEVLDPVLELDPDRLVLLTRRARWTYAELDRQADAVAAALTAVGVVAGDRVAAALPNDADIVASFHGAMRIGAVWVGLNRALAPPEKAYILQDSGTTLLLRDTDTASQLERDALDLGGLPRVVVGAGPEGQEWRSVLEASAGARRPPLVDPERPAALAYTSGTTGHPKGAVHSQHNLLVPGAVLVASRGYGPELRKGDCFPLTILNLQVLTTLLVAQAGGCSVIMDRIDAAGVAEWIRDHGVTTWNGPPALLHSLAHDPSIDRADLASLDEVWAGGADCPESLRAAFTDRFGLPVLTTYGLTEAPTVVSIDPRDGEHRRGASGRPLPHVRVIIRDDHGNEVSTAETGEICVCAQEDGPWAGVYGPPLGYWQRRDASEDLLRGGVVHTGDLGYVDAEGYLYVRDRRNQMIIRGGANVYPAEVERVLQAAPGVQACAVFGTPDERLGERVTAAVQVAADAQVSVEDLTRHCIGELARYKVPERFVFVESFVRNAMGKIDRRHLGEFVASVSGSSGASPSTISTLRRVRLMTRRGLDLVKLGPAATDRWDSLRHCFDPAGATSLGNAGTPVAFSLLAIW
jgi:acyl-CoA synthetase (AMP-forming)/AMP-acid ligase II